MTDRGRPQREGLVGEDNARRGGQVHIVRTDKVTVHRQNDGPDRMTDRQAVEYRAALKALGNETSEGVF
jgi:hypothetical protein